MKTVWRVAVGILVLAAVGMAKDIPAGKRWQMSKDFPVSSQTKSIWKFYSSPANSLESMTLLDWNAAKKCWDHQGKTPRVFSNGVFVGRPMVPNVEVGELAIIEWTSPADGEYRVTTADPLQNPKGGDGLVIGGQKISRWEDAEPLFSYHLSPVGKPIPAIDHHITLKKGDRIQFTHFCGNSGDSDEVKLDPVIELVSLTDKNVPPISLPIEGGEFIIDLNQPARPVTLRYNGETLPLTKNMGPVIIFNGRFLNPGEYDLELFRYSSDPLRHRVYAVYQITNFKKDKVYYWLTFRTEGSFLKIDMEMREPISSKVCPGDLQKPDDFKPLPMMRRLRESWQGNEVQAAYWNKKGRFWVYGEFELAHSNSDNGGMGCVTLSQWGTTIASEAPYPPYVFGRSRAVKETLRIGVSEDLWKAAGPLDNPPSEFAAELGQSMFVDLWGWNFHKNKEFLDRLEKQTAGTIPFYTIVQCWASGGFDKMNPDAYWTNELTPDKRYGTVDELKELVATAKKYGRVGMRTNYTYIVPSKSPSYKSGLIQGRLQEAIPEKGALINLETRNFTMSSQSDWDRLARFQETDIARDFGTNAQFVDQLASYGGPGAQKDFTPWNIGAGVGRCAEDVLKQFSRHLVNIYGGPVSSETLNAEQLLGYWVATGDYGIFNGANRLISPEYKLHRLHKLSTFHGMGLAYRFYGLPSSFKNTSDWMGNGHGRYWGLPPNDYYAGMDAYRALTVLYGNGAYFYSQPEFTPATRCHEEEAFTEAMTVGVLQRYYVLQDVKRVSYFWKGDWRFLNELMEDSEIQFQFVTDNCPAFKTIRVEYANGLTVTVNRNESPITIAVAGEKIVLPKDSFLGAMADGAVLVYSGIGSLSSHRIDFSLDKSRGLRFINPREKEVEGVTKPTLWIKGQIQPQ